LKQHEGWKTAHRERNVCEHRVTVKDIRDRSEHDFRRAFHVFFQDFANLCGCRTFANRLATVATVDTLVGGPTGEALGLALVCAGAAVPPWVTALLGAHPILHVETFLASVPCRAVLLLHVAHK
jgi:hypothetical protein